MKLIFLAFAAVVACNVTDDRPETLAYITETILEPSCGTAECHSAMKAEKHYVFDSVDAARTSLQDSVVTCDEPPCTTAPAGSYLLTVITQKDDEGNRMPLDMPLSNKDIVLIEQWILDGSPGLEAP
jgi:hypothetical protein